MDGIMNINVTNKWVAFFLICALKATQDGLNFAMSHNQGFFSLTYGPGSSWFDAWHISWVLVLIIIAVNFIDWFEDIKWQMKVLKLVAYGIIAYITQWFIYNVLFYL